MNNSLDSKSCGLKGYQQVFLLQQNQVSSCCRAYPEQLDPDKTIADYRQQWQYESQQLDQGVKLPGCKHCWEAEDQGKISYRQQNVSSDKGIEFELFISDLCNHMCSYCSPKYSSVWKESIKTHGVFQNISQTAKDNLAHVRSPADVDHWLEQIQYYINDCEDNSVLIRLLGGEPLMQQRNLEKLLSFDSKKLKKLMITTNLNPPTDKFLRWLLDNFPVDKLGFDISLDASPAYNHVPRAGFDKTNFLTNLELLQNKNIIFNFNSVVSVLGLFDLENFMSWLDQHNFKTKFSKINNPECLDPQLVPAEFRKQIWEKIKHLTQDPVVAEVLQQTEQLVDLKLFEQYNYLTQYFERTDIIATQIDNTLFVEYWTWLTNYINERFKK